jgi:hypothetical protein
MVRVRAGESNHLIKEKHWWVQAEAMVGFYNTWQINNHKYLDLSLENWAFVKQQYIGYYRTVNGFGAYTPMAMVMQTGEDKVGIWKCPYHNSRACIAISVKDARSVASPAIKPIIGGPIKKPIKPSVETAASATPGFIVFDLPAAL